MVARRILGMDGVVEVVATRGSDFDVFLFRYGELDIKKERRGKAQ